MIGIKRGWTTPILLVMALGIAAIKIGVGYYENDRDSLLFGAVLALIAATGFMFLWSRERERNEGNEER